MLASVCKIATGLATLLAASSCVSARGALAPGHGDEFRESLEDAAVNAKRLVSEHPTGTIATVFPDNSTNAGRPYAIMEYAAACHDAPGITFLLFPESVTTQNLLASPGKYVTYTVSEPFEGARSAVAQARVAFMGNMTVLSDLSDKERLRLSTCYRKHHPDVFWFPGRVPGHPFDSIWARFDPVDIYYVGGFGGTHYIGHIPVDLYAQAGEDARSAPAFAVQA